MVTLRYISVFGELPCWLDIGDKHREFVSQILQACNSIKQVLFDSTITFL